MRHALALEWIGEDHHWVNRACGLPYDGPWVARIKWDSEHERIKREFVRGQKDYSAANSVGSRGVMLYFAIEPGLYEVKARTSWKNSKRYFMVVEGPEQTRELSNQEAESWARENCWEPMY